MSYQSGLYNDSSFAPSRKTLGVGYLLWFLFGVIGAHRYYLREYKVGFWFLAGSVIATLVLIPSLVVTRVIGFIILAVVLVFWIRDAVRMRALVDNANAAAKAAEQGTPKAEPGAAEGE